MPLVTSLRPLLFCTLLLIASSLSYAENLFVYDQTAPLNVHEVGRDLRGGAWVRDLVFTPVNEPVKAYLVTPRVPVGAHAAILYVHWLGEPATTNRTEFLDEAVQLAERGVTSLLVDTMWANNAWYKDRVPENDFDNGVRQVIALRRALDFLLAQPDIDPARVAFVGHDFGAMYGTIALAQEPRVKTAVLMAGIPHMIDWMLYQQQPKDLAAYKVQIAPLDPVRYIGQLAPASSVFFQFASHDHYVSATQAAEFYAAANPRKHMATYEAGHDLRPPEVAADRIAWLVNELKLAPPAAQAK